MISNRRPMIAFEKLFKTKNITYVFVWSIFKKNNEKVISELNQELLFLNKKINEDKEKITELNEKISNYEENDDPTKRSVSVSNL